MILTVLVAILSKTFADISQDAAAESMFRKAVSTIEGVKSDAVSSYQAPFNLIAVVAMFPMKVRSSLLQIATALSPALTSRPSDSVYPLAKMVPQGQRDPHQDLGLPDLARHLVSDLPIFSRSRYGLILLFVRFPRSIYERQVFQRYILLLFYSHVSLPRLTLFSTSCFM